MCQEGPVITIQPDEHNNYNIIIMTMTLPITLVGHSNNKNHWI